MSTKTRRLIRKTCKELADFLCEKNVAYGDSAINPLSFRAKADAREQIRIRQDDKLNRIFNGSAYAGDDDMKDLVGYWILEQVINKMEEPK